MPHGLLQPLIAFFPTDQNFPQLKTKVTGKTGGSATFECLFDPLKKSSTRFWRKLRPQGGYDTIIDSAGFVKYNYDGRVAMFENPENKTVTVILNQLQSKDEGFYWCMSNEQKEQQTSTELKVVEGKGCALADLWRSRTTPGEQFFGKRRELRAWTHPSSFKTEREKFQFCGSALTENSHEVFLKLCRKRTINSIFSVNLPIQGALQAPSPAAPPPPECHPHP